MLKGWDTPGVLKFTAMAEPRGGFECVVVTLRGCGGALQGKLRRSLPSATSCGEIRGMAIFGPLLEIEEQLPQLRGLEVALEHARRCLTPGSGEHQRVMALATGVSEKVDLAGGVFAIEECYLSKADEDVRWEAHRGWVDLQLIVEGGETIEVSPVGGLELEIDHLPDRDLQFYRPWRGGSMLRIGAGMAAMFLPVDAHRPGLATGESRLVRKVVVKIPLEW